MPGGVAVMAMRARWYVSWLVLVLVLLMASGCGSEPAADANRNQEDEAGAEEAAAAEDGFSSGLYMVNDEITPGRYRTEGGVSYYARLSSREGSVTEHGMGADIDGIIASSAPLGGPIVLDIKSTDLAFETVGNGTWYAVDDSYQPELTDTFGDGYWIVGVDIAPGTYRTDDDVMFWQRLSDFSDEPEGFIDAGINVEGGAEVEIDSSDAGFMTAGGATWVRIE